MKKISLFIGVLLLSVSTVFSQDPTSVNPNNSDAEVKLSWLNDVARIRVAGTVPGAENGLDIQGPEDFSLMRLLGNGKVGIGTTTPIFRLEVTGDFGAAGNRFNVQQGILNQNSTINNWASGSNEGGIAFNYDGRQSPTGTTQELFRDLSIYNGKGSLITFFDGSTGNVGIGTGGPAYSLDVNGDIRFKYGRSILSGDGNNKILVKTGWDGIGQDYVSIHVPGNTGDGTAKMYIKSDGSVGIGVENPIYKLTVDGTISASEVKVSATPNSDFVFEQDYQLRSLNEVETFVKTNKHLPDIPSAEEFRQNGVGLGEMDNMLLQKIEELTLYMIELKKLNEAQKEDINILKEENKELKELILNQNMNK